MRIIDKIAAAFVLLLLLTLGSGAQAQTIQFTVRDISLKSGESTELGNVYFISSNCKSMLKATPSVEILDGPPGVTAIVNAAKVVPHFYGCSNPIAGGKLVLSASQIEDFSYTRMVLRINYQTVDGARQRTENINLTLVPSD
jgi:pseudouridine-5'-phosphate glycosidase